MEFDRTNPRIESSVHPAQLAAPSMSTVSWYKVRIVSNDSMGIEKRFIPLEESTL
jgi:hypothetical protein